MKVVIAGGAGALGRRMADDLAVRDHEVVILTRTRRPDLDHQQIEWDGRTVGPWAEHLDGSILVNLAGKLVDCRPTARNIEDLRRSRVEPTRALVEASKALTAPPTVWLQMSTLAIYGDAGQEQIDETHPPAAGPPQMAGVARPWEGAARDARADRRIVLRTGIVLDRGIPAFERLARLTELGLGGRISRGDQWVSWIHIHDFLAATRHLIEQPDLDGVVHVTAPNPIQNRDLMAALRKALHRPWSPPTPKPLVKIGALAMGSDPALALTGRRCIPTRLLDTGFDFEFAALPDALGDLRAAGS